jgi:hypothetical protein
LEVAQVLLWDHPKELLVLLHLECLHSGPLHLPMVPFLLDLPFPHRVKCYHKKTCSDINWKDIASGLEGVNRSVLKFNQLYETSQNAELLSLSMEVLGHGGSGTKHGTSGDQSMKLIYCRI